jgi:mono/diheme cytochrome c family protein
MTRAVVSRALLIFLATLVASVWAFAWLANRPAPEAPDAGRTPAARERFDAACGGCHSLDDMVGSLRRAPDLESGRRALLELLASHGDTPPEADVAIADFLVDSARRRP